MFKDMGAPYCVEGVVFVIGEEVAFFISWVNYVQGRYGKASLSHDLGMGARASAHVEYGLDVVKG